MCFSATASFAAAAGLGAIGVLTLREAKTRSRLPLAALPLLFGFQQAVEGVVWISSRIPWLQATAAFAYVAFSHVLWPFYMPFAVWAIEPPGRRKTVLKFFCLCGAAIGLWLAFYVRQGPISVSLTTCGIVYQMILPAIPYGWFAYVFVTCFSCLISSHKFIRVFGLASLGALVIALWSYQEAFYSMWCFFAAILSVIVYVHLRQGQSLWPRPAAKGLKA